MGAQTPHNFSEVASIGSLFAGRRVFYVGSINNRHNPTLLGGQRVTLQHVETLRKDGVEAFAVTNETGTTGIRTRFLPDGRPELMHMKQFRREIIPDRDLVVLPGRFAEQLDEFPGEHKILFSQGIWITLNAMSNRDESPFLHPTLKGIMVVSEGNAKIARLLRPDCPVIVVHNSVSRPANVDFSRRRKVILYPSLRRHEKNPWDTRAVLHVLRARYASGRCPEFIELDGLPHAHLLRLMREASVLLFLSTHEGLPLLPLEAMANGTLVLGYDRSPMSELLHDRCIFRFGDIEGIVDVLESIFNDASSWLDVQETCYTAMTHWSRDAQAESIRQAWRKILRSDTFKSSGENSTDYNRSEVE